MENSIINLGSLLGFTLSKWRKIIIFALIFCVLFGAYNYYNATKLSKVEEPTSTEAPEYDADYYDELRVYTNQANALQAEIDTLQDSVDNLTEYINSSPIMKIDSDNTNSTAIYIYIALDEQSSENPKDVLEETVDTYLSEILSGDVYDEINTALNYNVNVSYVREMLTYGVRPEEGYIYLRLTTPTAANNKQATEILIDYVESLYDDINSTLPHQLNIDTPIHSTVTDDVINNTQINAIAELNTATENLVISQAELDALVEPIAPKVIEPTPLTTTQIITQAILFAIIGAIAGAAIAIFCIALLPILTNKLQDGKYIKTEHNVLVFGTRPQFSQKNNPIDKFIFKLFNKTSYKNEDEFYDYIAASINVFNAESKSILLVGTVSNENLDSLAQILKDKVNSPITFAGNITENSKSLQSLIESEFVVLVEQIFNTSDEKLATEISLIKDLNKEIKGAIIL